MAPTRRVLPPGSTLIYTDPTAQFASYMQLAVMAGAAFAAPYVMVQVVVQPFTNTSCSPSGLPFSTPVANAEEIGRASCRERV